MTNRDRAEQLVAHWTDVPEDYLVLQDFISKELREAEKRGMKKMEEFIKSVSPAWLPEAIRLKRHEILKEISND